MSSIWFLLIWFLMRNFFWLIRVALLTGKRKTRKEEKGREEEKKTERK